MVDSPTQTESNKIFKAHLLWFLFLPALPFLLSIASLSFYIVPTDEMGGNLIKHLFSIDIVFVDDSIKTLTHISNLLGYLSVTAIHGFVCLGVIGFFLYKTHTLATALIKRIYCYVAISFVTFLVALVVLDFFSSHIMLIQLGYESICVLLSKADLQTMLVPIDPGGGHTGDACFSPVYKKLTWLAWTPVAFGGMVVVVASVFTMIMVGQPISDEEDQWRSEFLARTQLLQKGFYMLSLVLVTSVVAIYQFSSLPIDLLADQPIKEAYSAFTHSLTSFWGGVFTATLFATFLPAGILLLKHVRNHQNIPSRSNNLGLWLYESVFVSMRKQMLNTVMMVAPMLVGPLSQLLQNLSG